MQKPAMEFNDLMKMCDDLRPFIKDFEQKFWFDKGVAAHVRKSDVRGQRAKAMGLTILLWTAAGRTMITISDTFGDWVSVMVAEDADYSTMGFHSSSTDFIKAIPMLQTAANHGCDLTDDPKVGFAFF